MVHTPLNILTPGKIIFSWFISLSLFDRIIGCGFNHPFKIFCTNTGYFSIRSGVTEIDGIRYAIAQSKFNGIKIIPQDNDICAARYLPSVYTVQHSV